MKRFISLMLSLLFLSSLLASCKVIDVEPSIPESSAESLEIQESSTPEPKEWTHSLAEEIFAYKPTKFISDTDFFSVWYDDGGEYIKEVCDDGKYLAATLVHNYGVDDAKRKLRFYYNALPTLKYTIEMPDIDGFIYNVHVGVLPERYRGKTVEELMRDATDYYESFDMQSGYSCIAGERIDYVYHTGREGANPSAVAVFGDKWFIAIRPAFEGTGMVQSPERLFNDLIFSEREHKLGYRNMTYTATRFKSGVVLIKQLVGGYNKIDMKYADLIYDENGVKKNEFEAYTFFVHPDDESARLWVRSDYTEEGYKRTYCNKFGEETKINSATQITSFDREKGEFLGIIDGKIYIFDGDGKQEEFTLNYTSVKKLGNTEAVKFSDAHYALIKDGLFVRLYETDFAHESAALEYNEEYDAVFVGGDAITEIVNRYGEIVEAFWYDAPDSDPFEIDASGKYLLSFVGMSLAGDTYILDSDTFAPLAHLPSGVDYTFTSDGKIKVSYLDFENGDEYVEFTVTIEGALKNYAYDPEFPDCDCFDGFLTEEDFE